MRRMIVVFLAGCLLAGGVLTVCFCVENGSPGVSGSDDAGFAADMGTVREELPVMTGGSSLYDTVKQGGPLMIGIIVLGLISLTIIIERIIFFIRYRLWDRGQIERYLKRASETSKARYGEDMENYLRKAFQLYAAKLERGLSLLSGIGQISPIVGFLGTVLGMINAFAAIAAATTVNAKVVAVGIQIALVTTAGGLLVAAPSLTFFYFFMHLIQNRYAQSEEEIGRLCMGLPKLSETLYMENGKS